MRCVLWAMETAAARNGSSHHARMESGRRPREKGGMVELIDRLGGKSGADGGDHHSAAALPLPPPLFPAFVPLLVSLSTSLSAVGRTLSGGSCPSFERSASTRTISHANSTYTYSTHPEQSFHHNYSLRQESSNIWAESARCPYRSTVSSYNSPLTTFSHHTPSYPALNYYYHYPSYPMEVLLNRPASHQPVSSTSSSQHSAQPLHLNTSASSMLLNTNMTVSNPSRVASQPARFSHIPPFSADCAMLNFSSSMDGIFAAGSAPCSAPVMGHDESPAHSFPMSQIKQQPPSRTPTPSNNHDQALSQFNLMQPPNSRSFGGIGTGNGTGSATHLESDDRGTPITTTFSPNPLSSSAHNTTPPVLGNASMMGGVDSNITLWQFLFELLASNEHSHLLQWSNNDGEFKLIDAEAVARLWGARKGKPHMNYDKLSRALRYYYDKNIIRKVTGQKFVYRFVLGPNGLPQCGTSGTGHETSGIGSGGMLYAMSQMSRTNAMAAAAVASVVSDTAPEFRSPTTTARSTPDNHHPTPPNSSMQQPFMHPLQSAMGTETRRMSGATPPADRRTPRATPPSSSSSTTTSAPQQLAVSNSSCHGTGTPSPINSACSPSSTESSSGVSSAGTAVSSLSEMAMRSGENPIFAVPTTNTALRPPSNSSKPGSSRKRKNESMVPPPQHHLGGTNHHCRQSVGEIPSAFSRVMDGGRVEASRFSPLVDSNQQGQLPRHRDVASLMFNGDLSDSVTPGSTGSAKSSGQLGAAGSLSRRCIPKPLDLTAVNNSGSGGNGNGNNHCSTSTNNLNALNQITSSMNELMATAAVYSPLFSSASALNSHHQHLINQTLSPLVYAAASSLATGLVPPQSPLGQYAAQVLSASVLSAASPSLALYAAAVASPNVSQAPGLGLSAMWGNNGHSSLSTPICHRTPTQPLMAQALAAALASQSVQQSSQQHQHQQNQVFQFPPSALGTSLPTAITLAMLNGSSPHLHSPAIFGGALSTPSAHGKGGTNRSPDSLKTPIVNQPTVSLQEHVMELAANLRKG